MVQLPRGSASVKVSALSTNRVLNVPASAFLAPDIPGTTYKDTPCLSFLIEHRDAQGAVTRLLFALGIRKDWENLPPKSEQDAKYVPGRHAEHVSTAVSAIEAMNIEVSTEYDVAYLLQAHGVELASIDGIIFSHWHFDHVGDATRFPETTRIIVGPGFKSNCLPGFPADADSLLCGDAFENRELHEVDFSQLELFIASFPAIDWFDDGSFYLLHTPGHAVGHVSALARTSCGSAPGLDDVFVLLAGDVCHHAGELRPHAGHPLPVAISEFSNEGDRYKSSSEYLEIHPEHSTSQPFYRPACGGFNMDAKQMQRTVEKVALLDADPRVFVMLAHDHWSLSVINQFPGTINCWKEAGWAERSRWRFLQDFE